MENRRQNDIAQQAQPGTEAQRVDQQGHRIIGAHVSSPTILVKTAQPATRERQEITATASHAP